MRALLDEHPLGEESKPELELVQLDPDHPGFRDSVYRGRRNAIARAALDHRDGQPVPNIEYTDAEHAVWQTVWAHLSPLHERYACAEYLACAKQLALSRTRVPQLAEVNEALRPHFRMSPVAGLVSERAFITRLADGVFLSTQYMRHPSMPLYTPEPDVIHELVGHAATLAHPGFIDLNLAFGRAAQKATPERLRQIALVYWYTLEFGVVREGDALKVYGAGLLSSFGELGRFETQSELRPLVLDEVAKTHYDPTAYQSRLFVAESFSRMHDDVRAWLERD
jgi:phenylalanine-4-hydroxylase